MCSIVAVHGVFESGLEAWTNSTSGILWLRDLFPHQRHRVRVLLYQYNVEAFLSPAEEPADRILPLANSLVAELCADRLLGDAFKRPIIFICHGFGGLLVKRALVFSSSRRARGVEHLRSIFTSTYAILFFGTPHNGVQKESLLLRYHRSPLDRSGPSHFMINLLKGSEMLQEISDQFTPLMKRFAIFNLWEQKKTQTDNMSAYIVEEESAAPMWDSSEKCGVFATHSDMIKFSEAQDPGYRVVLEALIRYTVAAPAVITERWQKDLEALGTERQLEAEDLLKPSPRYLMFDNENNHDRNELFLVPRCSSTYFTGRHVHAKIVKEQFSAVDSPHEASRHKICVIYGLGGSGKTQFCLRYAEDNKPRYWGVFWVDASTEENAENSFSSLGQRMGKGVAFTSGMHWLSQCTKPWLLVIDNADDPEMDVSKYFPVGNSGHILITTRNPGATIHATVGHLRFSGMDPEDALKLLLKTAFSEDEFPAPVSQSRRIAQKLTSELGYLALAVANAGTSIRRNIYTLEMYLRHYLGHRKRMITSKSITNADQANIIATWEIPFQRILSRESLEYRDAVDLIHIAAFMHFDSIPEAVFERLWHCDGPQRRLENFPGLSHIRSGQDEGPYFRLRTALSILYNYSIIDHDSKNGVVSLHPVIQRWAKDRLSEEDQKYWLKTTIAVVAQSVSPLMEASGQKFRRSLLPHVEACLGELKTLYGTVSLHTVERAAEIERFSWVFAENGLWDRARLYQQDIWELRLKKLGRYDPRTIEAQRTLAQSNFNLFYIAPCISAQYQILKAHWIARPSINDWIIWPPWRPEHVPYCTILSDLTSSLWHAGKLELSKRAGERSVNGLMKRLGPEDPLTLTAMFNLGRTYRHLGNQRESHGLLIHVLRRWKRLFGLNHPDTLMARHELAMSYSIVKTRLPVAERIIFEVVEARKKVLGEEHAYTLWALCDLAKLLIIRQRPQEAIIILDRLIPDARRRLGDAHVGILMAKTNLVLAHVRLKRWTEAEALLKELLQALPEGHPDVLAAALGYVYIILMTGRKEDAQTECVKAMDIITGQTDVPANSPRFVRIVEQLTLLLRKLELWDRIETLKIKYPAIRPSDQQEFNVFLF